MEAAPPSSLLELPEATQAAVIEAAHNEAPVHGLTHNFYRYPARFSPTFVRAVIQAFTSVGDLVLDNHVGGGTTLVEALALGRDAAGIDISSLAHFVSAIKTTVYSKQDLERLKRWGEQLPDAINLRKWSIHFGEYADLGYYRHLEHPRRWPLRKAIEQAIGSAIKLGSPCLEAFGRCVILRTAQLALDGRQHSATVDEFRRPSGYTSRE